MRLLLRTLLFVLVVPGTLAGWLPWWIATWAREHADSGAHLELGVLRHAGWLLVAAGAAGLLHCALGFALQGQGTPSPFAPPRHFVAAGLYRHVRNPMYLSVVTVIVGQALLHESPMLLAWAAILLLLFQLFVRLYEERTLASRFGSSYEDYRRDVPRWLPRWRSGH